jgi:hypothetical protein
MALRRNSLLAGLIIAAGLSSPALADDSAITNRNAGDHRSDYLDDNYIYDYMTHRDTITVGLGDATTSNLQIMHPTPWPSYINKTRIMLTGQQGIDALDSMMQQGTGGGGSPAAPAAGSSGVAASGAN